MPQITKVVKKCEYYHLRDDKTAQNVGVLRNVKFALVVAM